MTFRLEKVVDYPFRSFMRAASKAEAFCRQHPCDPAVLLTETSAGMNAGRDPSVKAVIWRGAIDPEKLSRIQTNLTEAKIAKICSKYRYAESSQPIVHRPSRGTGGRIPLIDYILMRQTLGDDLFKNIVKVNKAFQEASRYSVTESWFNGYDESTLNIHVDAGVNYRHHLAVFGDGLEWFPGEFTNSEYFEKLRHFRYRSHYPEGLLSMITEAGDSTLFKGTGSNYEAPERCIRGLLHKSSEKPKDNPYQARLVFISEQLLSF